MKRFVLLIVVVLMPLLLAGCFRSAGDTVEPTQDAVPNPVALEATAEAPVSGAPITLSVPPITILAPTTRPPATETPAEATSTRPPQTILPAPTATPQFITPGSPLGPVVTEASLPQISAELTEEASAGALPEATRAVGDCVYIVESGDSLYAIAVAHDTTVDELLAANPDLEGDPPVLYPDDELILPGCDDGATRAAPPTSTRTPTRAPGTVSATGTATSGEVYTVEAGDTLFNIAIRYGLTVADIVAANPGMDPDRLSIGQRIVIPPGD